MPQDGKDVPLQAAHDILRIPLVSPYSPLGVPCSRNGFKRRLLRDEESELRLALFVRRINAGLHLVSGLVPGGARLLKTDLRVRAKEQHFPPTPDVARSVARWR